jgi:alternate signal-mediated exported protein
MNKMFKGAIATGAGVALLLGGAGTFALWEDDLDFRDNATITAGTLKFDIEHLDYADWEINGNPIVDGPDEDDTATNEIEAVRFVPGDVVTMTWDDVPLIVDGDYLVAEFGVSLDGLDFNLIEDEDARDAARAFFADLQHEVKVRKLGETEWHTSADNFDLVRGTEHFQVQATVTFDAEAMDQLAYGAAIPLQGLGLTVKQVPHDDHTQNP